jgi:N-acetyl-gamma-glutamyl-phosphate reductase
LQIHERLAGRDDLRLLEIAPELHRDPVERARLMNASDLVFLCLPDDAAREAVTLVENPATRIVDASTAHRTAPGWVYGFPELGADQRAAIARATRLANPGCHASGFVACVFPLVRAGIVPADYPLACFSLTGYSGGGKKMIADYEAPEPPRSFASPRIYGLTQQHKHLPEMRSVCGLTREPVFCPVVDDYYCGMATTISLEADLLGGTTTNAIREALAAHYANEPQVGVATAEETPAMLAANELAGTDRMCIVVAGDGRRTTVTALFDNLGKGASGAAVQNMNIMLGLGETTGLR